MLAHAVIHGKGVDRFATLSDFILQPFHEKAGQLSDLLPGTLRFVGKDRYI